MLKTSIVLVVFALTAFAQNTFEWNFPKPFPRPMVFANNPMSSAKVDLGRHLFYDERMSVNGKQSCATCHKQELAFTDGRARAQGTTGELHPRSSMTLTNVAVQGFSLSVDEKKDLVAFLESLTDPQFLKDPKLGNPWTR